MPFIGTVSFKRDYDTAQIKDMSAINLDLTVYRRSVSLERNFFLLGESDNCLTICSHVNARTRQPDNAAHAGSIVSNKFKLDKVISTGNC